MRLLLLISLVIGAVALQASCVSPTSVRAAAVSSENDAAHEIALISQACVDAWNRGDLKSFLAPYADDVVIIYNSGPEKGIRSLEARLRRSQAWDGRPPQIVARIGHSEASLIDLNHALQIADIIMQEPSRDVHLWVTSVLKRTSHGWVVIHEQSF